MYKKLIGIKLIGMIYLFCWVHQFAGIVTGQYPLCDFFYIGAQKEDPVRFFCIIVRLFIIEFYRVQLQFFQNNLGRDPTSEPLG